MVTKQIEKRVVTMHVGSVVELSASGRCEALLPSDWDRAAFRYPNPIMGWEEKHAIACNIEISGRTFQRRSGGTYWVKVRITWVGDGELNTYGDGWLKVDPWACEYA